MRKKKKINLNLIRTKKNAYIKKEILKISKTNNFESDLKILEFKFNNITT
jgi:hypothetical protein